MQKVAFVEVFFSEVFVSETGKTEQRFDLPVR